MEQIISLDKELFLILNNLGTPAWDGFWVFMSERTYWIPFYIILLYILHRCFGIKRTLLILALTLLLVLVTDQLTGFIKGYFQRPRPCFTLEFEGIMRGVSCEGRGKFGFTSAHASNHFGVALLLGLIFREKIKWMIWLLLIWAAFISYSRVYLGVHFPLDILCGMFVGLSIALIFYWFYNKILRKYPNKFSYKH